MKLLDKTSLANTIDNVNEALFYNEKISKSEAKEIVKWISSRLNTEYSYNGSFGITAKDFKSNKIYTFTGERLSSPASMRHIMAEEASRVLRQLSEITGAKIPALEESDKRLLKGIKASEAEGKPVGTYCCGPCTVGLWRNMAVGGLRAYSKKLSKGLTVLKKFRDGKGSWRRFPFYYTISVLSELNSDEAKKEMRYAKGKIERSCKTMKHGRFSERRFNILITALAKIS